MNKKLIITFTFILFFTSSIIGYLRSKDATTLSGYATEPTKCSQYHIETVVVPAHEKVEPMYVMVGDQKSIAGYEKIGVKESTESVYVCDN